MGADAKAAYAALMDFKDVVKAHPITPAAATSSGGGAIADAAKKLSAAAYPLLQDIDWSSDLALKKPSGASAKEVLQAIDKALVMGASNGWRGTQGSSPGPRPSHWKHGC